MFIFDGHKLCWSKCFNFEQYCRNSNSCEWWLDGLTTDVLPWHELISPSSRWAKNIFTAFSRCGILRDIKLADKIGWLRDKIGYQYSLITNFRYISMGMPFSFQNIIKTVTWIAFFPNFFLDLQKHWSSTKCKNKCKRADKA